MKCIHPLERIRDMEYTVKQNINGQSADIERKKVMSRPKGSKNRKTLMEEARVDERIAEQKEIQKKFQKEQAKLLKEIEDRKQKLKEVNKGLRVTTRTLDKLQEEKAQRDARENEAAAKMEVEKVVASLVSSGKSAEEILEILKRK